MTAEDSKWHAKYEALDDATRQTIDDAYTAARKQLAFICKPANDDRAEELVAALTKYALESEPL